MKMTHILVWGLLTTVPPALADSPYAGEERRAIKSLSDADVSALENGDGMGFAKLAELNSYPGPRHVLDLATELGLSKTQREQTGALFEAMRNDAILVGKRLIDAEAALDRAFAEQSLDAESLHSALTAIGVLHAELRHVHLAAHLRQAEVLTAEQIVRYDELRGYGDGERGHARHDGHH